MSAALRQGVKPVQRSKLLMVGCVGKGTAVVWSSMLTRMRSSGVMGGTVTGQLPVNVAGRFSMKAFMPSF